MPDDDASRREADISSDDVVACRDNVRVRSCLHDEVDTSPLGGRPPREQVQNVDGSPNITAFIQKQRLDLDE